jgi:catechol 2,3-dioxygenase-like lactoylglutathione lyase family enzyme
MSAIRGIVEIVLAVHDLERALAFYQSVLGLERIPAGPEVKPAFLRAGPGQAGIPQMVVLVPLSPDTPAFSGPRTLHHLALELEPQDFDPQRERLHGLGFTIRDGRHPVIDSRTMYIDDPEGNEVELICRQ